MAGAALRLVTVELDAKADMEIAERTLDLRVYQHQPLTLPHRPLHPAVLRRRSCPPTDHAVVRMVIPVPALHMGTAVVSSDGVDLRPIIVPQPHSATRPLVLVLRRSFLASVRSYVVKVIFDYLNSQCAVLFYLILLHEMLRSACTYWIYHHVMTAHFTFDK